jgi:hypothetical protein
MLVVVDGGNNAIVELSGMHRMHDSRYVMSIVHCTIRSCGRVTPITVALVARRVTGTFV